MKVKVNVRLDVRKHLKELNRPQTLKEIGDAVVDSMKETINSGLSPVKGEGRFEAYSGANDRRKYPFNVQKQYPNKTLRPVNLTLSGHMLNALSAEPSGGKITIGIGGKEAEKAQRHQLGDDKSNLPRRRFIPAQSGEQFIVSITRLIRDLYSEALSAILKK